MKLTLHSTCVLIETETPEDVQYLLNLGHDCSRVGSGMKLDSCLIVNDTDRQPGIMFLIRGNPDAETDGSPNTQQEHQHMLAMFESVPTQPSTVPLPPGLQEITLTEQEAAQIKQLLTNPQPE